MVLEGKLGTFKCGCDKHYEGKKGRSGLLLCQGEQAKVGRWGVLCFAKKNGLRGSFSASSRRMGWGVGNGPLFCQGEQAWGGVGEDGPLFHQGEWAQ